MSRPWLVTMLASSLIALEPGALGGELVEEDLDTLRGITAIALEIEPTPDFVPPSISEAALRSEIEQRLRAAGIALNDAADPEISEANGWSYLYIGLLLYCPDNRRCVYVTRGEFFQVVQLARDPSVLAAARTWEAVARMGEVKRAKLATLKDAVLDLADDFVTDYLAANPAD